MSKSNIIGLSIIAVFIGVFMVSCGYVVSVNNREVGLRTQIEAKQTDNTSEYDNMWKKISQVAQVTEGQKNALKEIFVEHAEARSNEGAGKIASWIHESVPNVDTSTFNNLQNIITSSRDAWTQRQKELIDYNREHKVLLRKFPSSILLSMLGRKELDIQIVTSTRTQDSFKSGTDDDVLVFPSTKKQPLEAR